MNTQTQEALDFLNTVMDRTYTCREDAVISDVRKRVSSAINLLKNRQATQPMAADAEAVLKKHLECNPSKIIQHSYLPAVIEAMKEYASQPKGAGVWVKASERLPEKGYCFGGDYEQFVVRFKFEHDYVLGIGYVDDNYKIFNAHTCIEFMNEVEWYDDFSYLPSQEGQQ